MSEKFGHKLNAFYQFRSIFAPLIEGLILLDRLTYLQEQVSFCKTGRPKSKFANLNGHKSQNICKGMYSSPHVGRAKMRFEGLTLFTFL